MYRNEILEVEGSPMDTLVFEPEGSGPVPGIVVAQHLPTAHMGLEKDPFTIDIGERFAAAGYACVIPFIFHWWPTDEELGVKREEFRDDRVVADLDAAYALAGGLDQVDASRIGIIGHCWGGRVSWLGACQNPDYAACAVLYGGRVKLPMADGAVAPIELADRIKCPMIGIFGNDDQNPSPEVVDEMDAALTQAGVDHVFHRYDGAGHGFQDFHDPDRYRKTQADDAWEKVMTFFDQTLKT